MLPNFQYVQARSLRDAARRLAAKGARLHAGGTDLLGCLRDGVFGADTLVSLSKVAGLRGVHRRPNGSLRIGVLTPLAELAADRMLLAEFPVLAQAAGSAASPQLRNQGTLGGNLCQKPRCWYYRGQFLCLRKGGDECFAQTGQNRYHCVLGGGDCVYVHPSDTAPALVALGASLQVTGPRGQRRIRLQDFFVPPQRDVTRETVLGPGEIVSQVLVPPARGARSAYRKLRDRRSWDFALASLALVLRLQAGRITRARVVLGGVAPVPWRSRPAERVLEGQAPGTGLAERAARAALEDAQALAQNGYKLDLVRALFSEQLPVVAGA